MKPITIGDIQVTSIVERQGPWRHPADFFLDIDPAAMRARMLELGPVVYDAAQDMIIVTYQTFILRTRHHVILVDTCTGEDKSGLGPKFDYSKQPWLDGLAAEGLGFGDIDYVFCTHLHFDHCGWNTRLVDGRWVPTFPNATYLFSRREYAFWEAATAARDDMWDESWQESCLPVVEAGQARLVDDDYALDDNVRLSPSAGHSPGHVCVNIESKGQRAIFTGDMMHHPVQCSEPAWCTVFCHDPAAAAASRRRVLGAVADTDITVVPAHFPGVTAGRVRPDGDGFRFEFLTGP
jgi:glyoxylase-like metal-dependent hydrolase (beta-lactamase superfamily II)